MHPVASPTFQRLQREIDDFLHERASPEDFRLFRNVLDEPGIEFPHAMIDEILPDGAENKVNKRVVHAVRGGEYIKNVLYEEVSCPLFIFPPSVATLDRGM